jgi:hypothetical protein
MGLDISEMLTPYGIVLGNAATPLGSVVLRVTFGTKDNYRTEYIKFEVEDFNLLYHAILGGVSCMFKHSLKGYLEIYVFLPYLDRGIN